MENLLPVATSTATQVTYITTTGLEKILVIVGFVTILSFALIGLISIIVSVVRGSRKSELGSIKKINLK